MLKRQITEFIRQLPAGRRAIVVEGHTMVERGMGRAADCPGSATRRPGFAAQITGQPICCFGAMDNDRAIGNWYRRSMDCGPADIECIDVGEGRTGRVRAGRSSSADS